MGSPKACVQENRAGHAEANTQLGNSSQMDEKTDLGIHVGTPRSVFLAALGGETPTVPTPRPSRLQQSQRSCAVLLDARKKSVA